VPPITTKDIPAIYQKAVGLQNAGKLDAALELYQSIARINPRLSEVHFQVARIFASVGKFDKALPHARQAAQIKPKEPAVWMLWAEVLAGLGDDTRTEGFVKALRRSPLPGPHKARVRQVIAPHTKAPMARAQTAGAKPEQLAAWQARLAQGDAAAVIKNLRAALKEHPDSAPLLHMLARAQAAGGDRKAALKTYGAALKRAPDAGQIHADLGRLLLDIGRPVQAAEELRRATRYAPDLAAAWSDLGRALGQMDQSREGLEVLAKACDMAPDMGEAHFNRAILLVKQERDEEAVEAFQKSIDLGHATPQAYAMMARAQGVLRRESEALANFDRALALTPDYAFAYARRAALLQTAGDFDAAEADFRKAMALEPDNGETYRIFGASHKFSADDPLLQQMLARWKDPALSDTNRMNLGFALAKALEDSQQYDKVFSYLNTANALMRKAYPYDVHSRAVELDKVRAAFDGVDFEARAGWGDSSFAPIFVTGLPRSGTTLVEQILASHSTVTGAGEIGEFSREGLRLIATPQGSFHAVAGLSEDQIAELGHHYTAYMRGLFPEADRITDKSIQTYTLMGFVKLALPRARVVVVRRDPRDNLLSIYKNVFLEGAHRYAYSLHDLGIYYKLFEQTIDYWRARLPGYFHEISYDALTADPETEARNLLAACDLEWEDACLSFHQNRNRVDTLSVYQVRQPIYRSSVKAWQRYENDLGELFEALK